MRYAFLALFLCALSFGTFVHGDVYREGSAQDGQQTIIIITGPFTYQLVTTKSNYSLDLPKGTYTLSAQSGEMKASSTVSVGAEDQQIDLVLRKEENFALYVLAAVVLVAVLLAYRLSSKGKLSVSLDTIPDSPSANSPSPIEHFELDDDSKSVLKVLESTEGRATQRELKETLHFSDAKLSLILSELESLGEIRKFKRGRGNIIRKI